MLLETMKKVLAAVGVYLCMIGLLKAAIHTNYAIQEKDGRRMAAAMSVMALLFSCCFCWFLLWEAEQWQNPN